MKSHVLRAIASGVALGIGTWAELEAITPDELDLRIILLGEAKGGKFNVATRKWDKKAEI